MCVEWGVLAISLVTVSYNSTTLLSLSLTHTLQQLEKRVRELEKALEGASIGVVPVSTDGLRDRRSRKSGRETGGLNETGEEEEEEDEGDFLDAGRSPKNDGGFNLSLWQILLLLVAAFLVGRLTVATAA